jgi:hypothetical protein
LLKVIYILDYLNVKINLVAQMENMYHQDNVKLVTVAVLHAQIQAQTA